MPRDFRRKQLNGFQMKFIQFHIKTCNNDLQLHCSFVAVSGIWHDGLQFELFLNGCVRACHSFQNVEWDFAVLRNGFDSWCKRKETVFVNGVRADNQRPGNQRAWGSRIVLFENKFRDLFVFKCSDIYANSSSSDSFSFFVAPFFLFSLRLHAFRWINNTII